jgi:hypothetical protein
MNSFTDSFRSCKSFLFATFLMVAPLFTVSPAIALQVQGQTFPTGLNPDTPTPVERFLREYTRTHPITLNMTGSHSEPAAQPVDARTPKIPNLLRRRLRPDVPVCSIPLLQKKIDRSKSYSIEKITPLGIDRGMPVKPASPACATRY